MATRTPVGTRNVKTRGTVNNKGGHTLSDIYALQYTYLKFLYLIFANIRTSVSSAPNDVIVSITILFHGPIVSNTER